MGFTSLNHWTDSDNTFELVELLQSTSDVSGTLQNWFQRTTNEYNTSPEQDLCLVLEDGIITKDQVPVELVQKTVSWLSNQLHVKQFQREHKRMLKQLV
jgi:hypothetical protein